MNYINYNEIEDLDYCLKLLEERDKEINLYLKIIAEKEQEIERLNNIINKGIEYIEERFAIENGEYYLTHTFDKCNVKELYDILRGDKE